MGGQQFASGSLHLDTRGLDRVVDFDRETGHIEVEAGIQWPALIERYLALQAGAARVWGIAQKQTGADRLSLGGALASNVHGRGLTRAPFVGDIESFTLLDGRGELIPCSRHDNTELFRLAVGGYGLFGVVYSIRLRLTPRRKLERVVEVRPVDGLAEAVGSRVDDGFLYGDFQFKTDAKAPDFLQRGVFSCYRPVADETPMPASQRRLRDEDWLRLLHLAHFDKARGFEEYAGYYLTTNGQLYWSDTHQLGFYADDYHSGLDRASGAAVKGSEMISEVYVPRAELAGFLAETADAFRAAGVDVIYGTVRFIEPDEETFLPWARQAYAAIVFNLHVDHSPAGIQRAKREFRSLIDLARKRGGSYFLTYHRWATRQQVDACYPEMARFLDQKLAQDPDERFQSNWYRHYKAMYSEPA
jgi:FAD/FMN-containing dehydrogenase